MRGEKSKIHYSINSTNGFLVITSDQQFPVIAKLAVQITSDTNGGTKTTQGNEIFVCNQLILGQR